VDVEVELQMVVYRGLLHTPTTSSLNKKGLDGPQTDLGINREKFLPMLRLHPSHPVYSCAIHILKFCNILSLSHKEIAE